MSGKLLNSEPLYVQLRTALARRIASGDWKPGETIPNELDLAKEYGLSAGTVRKALDWMEEAKLISRQQGRGTFVTDPASKESSRRFNRLRDADGAILRCEKTTISVTTQEAASEELLRLGLAAGDRVTKICNLASAQGKALMHEEIAVPTALFPTLGTKQDAGARLPYDLLELAQRNGLLIGKGQERISIAAADTAVASQLGITAGTYIAIFDRVVYTIEDRPVEWRKAWCNLDTHHYLAELG